MRNQCKKCGRMLLIAETPIKDKHLLFSNANVCSRCLREEKFNIAKKSLMVAKQKSILKILILFSELTRITNKEIGELSFKDDVVTKKGIHTLK